MKIVPDLTVAVDGTHIDIQRPTDREPRKEGVLWQEEEFYAQRPGNDQQGQADNIRKQVGSGKHARPHHDKGQPLPRSWES